MPGMGGMGRSFGRLLSGGGGRRFTPDFFVDSESGDDGNDGLTLETAFQTIGTLGTIQANAQIGLVRGSYWREQIDTSAAGVDIRAVGDEADPLPTLDAADIASSDGWTPHASLSNIYQRTWTHDSASGESLSLWEDGVRVRWVASTALLDAAASGFNCVTNLSGTSTTVYYKATGAGDPASNGLLVEISARMVGIRLSGNNSRLEDVHGRRQLSDSGSIVVSGIGSTVERCLAEDGTSHNLFIGRNCRAIDCIAWKSDWADRVNTTAFIAHTTNGAGYTAEFLRCIVVNDLDKVSAGISGTGSVDGFYTHTSGTNWDSVSYTDCSVYGAETGYSCDNAVSFVSTRNFATECRIAHLVGGVTAAEVTDFYAKEGTTVEMRQGVAPASPTVINGLRSYGTSGSTQGDVYANSSAAVRVERSVIYHVGAINRFAVNGNSVSSDIESEGNIVQGNSASTGFRAKGTGKAANNNNYSPANMNFEIASTNADFAAYRSANPTLDANSVTTDPGLTDPANGDFSGSNISAGMGLERPEITGADYTPIPSDVALAAM